MNMNPKSKSKGWTRFFAGLFTGIALTIAALVLGGIYFMRNPELITKQIHQRGSRVISHTMQSLPKEYLADKQDEVIELVNAFVRAYSEDRITFADMDRISQKAFTAAADSRITPREADEFMVLVREIVNR
jgi:hypothetical protein